MKQNPPRIALVVDNPLRDLPGLVLLAWRLCQAGATCFLVPFSVKQVTQELGPLVPDFVVFNYLRTNNQELVEHASMAGMGIGILDTEGGVFTPLPCAAWDAGASCTSVCEKDVDAFGSYRLTMTGTTAAVRRRVDRYLVWNECLADYVQKMGWYSSTQVTVTGTPRTDYYVSPWREAARQMSSCVDEYSKPLVLINGNFPVVNPRFQRPEEEAEMMVRRFGYDRRFVERLQDSIRQALMGIIELSNRLAEVFPDVTFIVRPHPFESDAPYNELLERRSNLLLVREGAVDGWLLRANALIHWTCSTSIEAYMAGVPAFSPAWLPRTVEADWHAYSRRPRTLDVLIGELHQLLTGRFPYYPGEAEEMDRGLAKLFFKVDGKSHERVADSILASVQQCRESVSLDACKDLAYGLDYSRRFSGDYLSKLLKKKLGLSIHWKFRHLREHVEQALPWDGSPKSFTAEDVRRVLSAISAHAPLPKCEVRVEPCQEAGAYHFGYSEGRSVMLFVD